MSGRGIFCLSGVGKYDAGTRERLGITDLRSVPTEIATMRQALESLGLIEHLAFEEDERSHYALDLGLTGDIPVEVETLIIYCTGHGRLRSGRYQLLLPQGNWFNPAKLIEPLEEDEWSTLRDVMLIVDACSAEPGVDAAWLEARKVNTQTSKFGFWGIGASRRLEAARQKSFATAFAEAIDRAARPSWTVSHLDPAAIASAVNRELGPRQTVWLAEGHPAQPCQALPNPRYQKPFPPTGLPLPPNWATAARGVAASDIPGFFFTGRHAMLHELREHLARDDDHPIAVVTGTPGSGRSALLGQLVLITDDRGRRAMPNEVRQIWPALPVLIAVGRGNPSQVIHMLTRELVGPDNGLDLIEALGALPKPIGIVLDDLDETAESEQWTQLLGSVRSVPGIRLVIGLPAESTIPLPSFPRIYNLDDLGDGASQDIRTYLDLQVRLAVPGAPEQEIRRAVGVLAGRTGVEFEAAAAVTGIPRSLQGGLSVDDYLTSAARAIDIAAHRVCRTRLEIALGNKAGGIVSALSALCSYDETVALPAAEWAAAACIAGKPSVDTQDIATAAQLMRSLAENRPATDGTARWRARFGHPDAGGYPEPDVFLQRLPQVVGWETVNWRAVDPGVLVLVARAAALGMIPGRLLDDPAFLLGAPPTVVSKAIQKLKYDPGERARRSRMWRLVPSDASADDRALLLRIGSQRFNVKSVASAFESARYRGQHGWQPAGYIDWVQPDGSSHSSVICMAATAPGSRAVVITIQDDNSLAFWNPADGSSIRQSVTVPGIPRAVTAAVIRGSAVALVSTWQRGIWMVACRENAAPVPVSTLIPPRFGGVGDSRTVPLLLALHPSGYAVIASGTEVWTGELGGTEALHKLVTMDSELLSVHIAGPLAAPVAWLFPESGRVRRLPLGRLRAPEVAPFPIPERPLTTAVSATGDRALIVDVTGGLHLRGVSAGDGALTKGVPSSDVRAVAIDASMAIVAGGSAGRTGWLDIHDLTSRAAPLRVPLDDPVVHVVMHGLERILVARVSGLLSMRRTGQQSLGTAESLGDSHE